jgi:hypothetical protein
MIVLSVPTKSDVEPVLTMAMFRGNVSLRPGPDWSGYRRKSQQIALAAKASLNLVPSTFGSQTLCLVMNPLLWLTKRLSILWQLISYVQISSSTPIMGYLMAS